MRKDGAAAVKAAILQEAADARDPDAAEMRRYTEWARKARERAT